MNPIQSLASGSVTKGGSYIAGIWYEIYSWSNNAQAIMYPNSNLYINTIGDLLILEIKRTILGLRSGVQF